jgi:hypothetical protein
VGSFTVSVRGVSLDSCIEARAVPVGVGGRGGVEVLRFNCFSEFLERFAEAELS